MSVIEVNNLTKVYSGGNRAVDSLTLSLGGGEVFGFLGPNGAGKTTTVKLLTGILSPTEGEVQIYGVDPFKSPEKAHALCGIVTERAQMYDRMSGLNNLLFYASVFGVDKAEGESRARELLSLLELDGAANDALSTYSTGMRQRLSLARALIHRPKILFLDEPTSGLDPESARSVNALIKNLATKQGITVFLCTHQLRYAQEICSRYGLISGGRLIADGNLQALRAKAFGYKTLKIRASGVPEGLNLRDNCGIYEGQIVDDSQIADIVKKIVLCGESVYSVECVEGDLEDIYFALTGVKDDE